MLRKFYRIYYRVVELSGAIHTGGRVITEPIDEYMKVFRRTYPDATSVYMELREEFEDDDDESATAEESVIILG